MTKSPAELEEQEATREELIVGIVGAMPDAHRRFLLSFKRGHDEDEGDD